MGRYLVVLVLAVAGCVGDDESGDDSSPQDAALAAAAPTCASICKIIAAACGTSGKDCAEECGRDQASARGCGEGDAWQTMLECCADATYPPGCDDSFDACQSEVCGDLRPASAADGC